MKRIVVSTVMLLLGMCEIAQNRVPKSQKEDKDHTMSEAYWDIWNPKVSTWACPPARK